MLNFRSGPVRPYFSILMRIHENNEKRDMATIATIKPKPFNSDIPIKTSDIV